MLRKLGILLMALLLAAAISDTLAWYWAVGQMRARVGDWIAAQRTAGWSVEAAAPEAGGWPFSASLTVHDVSLQGGKTAIPGGIDWETQRLLVRLTVRQPRMLLIDAAGMQHLRVGNGPDLRYTAQHLHLSVPLQAAPSALPLELQGEALRVSLPGHDPLTIEHLAARAVLHPGASLVDPAATLAFSADGIQLPADARWALGGQIGSLSLDAALNGPLPNASGPTAAATAWRDGGGSLAVREVTTQWGPLGLSANGTLRLDAALQPIGNGDAKVTGYGATLDALARHGVMSRSAAMTATAVLSLMAGAPAGGGPAPIKVPLSLRAGVLSMQHVPLLRLPTLDWPPA